MNSRNSSEYTPVAMGDGAETSSSSSTDVRESKGFLWKDNGGGYMSSRRRRLMSSINWPVALSIIFLISGITVWAHVVVLLRNFHCSTEGPKDKFEPDLEYSSRVTFQPNHFMGGRPTNATNEMWQRLSPPGDGIVAIPRKHTKGLPPSLPAKHVADADIYGISMFHQLHCLNFLRFAYYPEDITDMDPTEIVFHRDHCLDYIRQAIQCQGDVTFEFLTEVGINGMGTTHQCRDFSKIWTWAYEQRSDKTGGSGYTGGVVTHTPADRNDFDQGPAKGSGAGGHHHHP